MNSFLKAMAITCKLVAILFWLGHAWVAVRLDVSDLRATSEPHYRDAPEDWGTPAFTRRMRVQIFQELTLVALAFMPNRWLVFSPIIFCVALATSFWPLYPLNIQVKEWSDLIVVMVIVALFSPLPLSLVLSFVRGKRGGKVGYV